MLRSDDLELHLQLAFLQFRGLLDLNTQFIAGRLGFYLDLLGEFLSLLLRLSLNDYLGGYVAVGRRRRIQHRLGV